MMLQKFVELRYHLTLRVADMFHVRLDYRQLRVPVMRAEFQPLNPLFDAFAVVRDDAHDYSPRPNEDFEREFFKADFIAHFAFGVL